MTDTPIPLSPEERDALAGELALVLLTGEARAQAMRLQLADPAFAALVAGWNDRFGPLHDRWIEQAPSEALWGNIAARITPVAPDSKLVTRLNIWRAGAMASGAIAAALALVLLVRPVVPMPSPIQRAPMLAVAQMTSPGADIMVVARYDPARGQLQLKARDVPQGQLVPELWVIPADGKPRSLGLIAPSGDSHMAVSPDHRAMLADGATLAITMERATGAPHAAPSSTPVAAGKISII